MAPPLVLLDRIVDFVTAEDEASSDRRRPGKQPVVRFRPTERMMSMKERAEALVAKLEAMKPDLHVHMPPQISYLSMVYQKAVGLPMGSISCTNKGLVVLYAGQYQPGYAGGDGCYLVYDASMNSLCAIPQVPGQYTYHGLGRGVAILSLDKGSFLLAELVKATSGYPDAELFLWKSPCANKDQWIRRKVGLPSEFSGSFHFHIDMVFVHTESRVCWVDLCKGVLVADQIESPQPEFTFVALPIAWSRDPRRGRPHFQEFRTMGSVCGRIKFVDLVGYYEGGTPEEVTLKTYTLSPDLKTWLPPSDLCVKDLWKAKSFLESGLPQLAPSFPVLSFNEDNVLYVVLNDWYHGSDDDEMPFIAHYVLGLNTMLNNVVCCTKVVPHASAPHIPDLFATELSARFEDGRGGLEGNEAEASGKQIKHASEPGVIKEQKKRKKRKKY